MQKGVPWRNNRTMHRSDTPIKKASQDKLNYSRFARKLGDAILAWDETESIVIALYGAWGSGKSSILSMTMEHIGERAKSSADVPTVIEFNPWQFSGSEKLNEQFFLQIASELELKEDAGNDKELAQKIRSYLRLLEIFPERETVDQIFSIATKVLGAIGLASIAAGVLAKLPQITKVVAYVLTGVYLLVGFGRKYLEKMADFYDRRADKGNKPLAALKKELAEHLSQRGKKLLVVIDDIDRLPHEEIRLIFRLIKSNSDLPNTMYLLAFDRDVIEQNLEEQRGVSGKDYLEKIVQVGFDIPFVQDEKVLKVLLTELDEILATLPDSYNEYWDSEYWMNVYHSGFRFFFGNIRTIKRYINSLEFNISMLQDKNTAPEVNPVDFFAIEAIRVFCPDFHHFIKTHKELFTSTREAFSYSWGGHQDSLKDEFEQALKLIPEEIREDTKSLIMRLFPPLEGVVGNTSYGAGFIEQWNRKLRVCSHRHFDAYFTLVPGGDEKQLSNTEIQGLLKLQGNASDFAACLDTFITNGKMELLLERLQDYTDDRASMPDENMGNVVLCLFNISDKISIEAKSFLGFGADMDLMRVVYQLLKRLPDEGKRFTILRDAAQNSTGLLGPLMKISIEADRTEKKKGSDDYIVTDEHIEILKKICVAKIEEFANSGKLVGHRHLVKTMHIWADWGDQSKLKKFVDSLTSDEQGLLDFVEKFVTKQRSQTQGSVAVNVREVFAYKAMNRFLNWDEVHTKLERIKNRVPEVYEKKGHIIDLFLDNFDKKESNDLFVRHETRTDQK